MFESPLPSVPTGVGSERNEEVRTESFIWYLLCMLAVTGLNPPLVSGKPMMRLEDCLPPSAELAVLLPSPSDDGREV